MRDDVSELTNGNYSCIYVAGAGILRAYGSNYYDTYYLVGDKYIRSTRYNLYNPDLSSFNCISVSELPSFNNELSPIYSFFNLIIASVLIFFVFRIVFRRNLI